MMTGKPFRRRDHQVSRRTGYDVDTVSDEGMEGAFDADVLAAAAGATRARVTLDLDFSNPFRFPPEATAGIVVLRVSDRPGRVELEAVLERLCTALEIGDPTSQLWVVDARRGAPVRPAFLNAPQCYGGSDLAVLAGSMRREMASAMARSRSGESCW